MLLNFNIRICSRVVLCVNENTSNRILGSYYGPWFPSGVGVSCKSCGSVDQSKFSGEMAIHFPGLKNIDKPVVWVFPELVVCLNCGTAQFAVPEAELRLLAKAEAPGAE